MAVLLKQQHTIHQPRYQSFYRRNTIGIKKALLKINIRICHNVT